MRFRGPLVSQLQVVFLGDLYLELERRIDSADVFPPIAAAGKVHAHVLPSGPLHDFSHTRKVLTTLIHNASRRVCVTTPYFIPDAIYVNALQTAALRGAEVRLVVPMRSDSLIAVYQAFGGTALEGMGEAAGRAALFAELCTLVRFVSVSLNENPATPSPACRAAACGRSSGAR